MPKNTPAKDDTVQAVTLQAETGKDETGNAETGKAENGKARVKKLRKIIKSTGAAMLTTVTADGSLRSRPMATLDAPFDGYLWFFTHATAPVALEIQKSSRVNLSYAEGERYLSVSGTASVTKDPERVKDLWEGWLKSWFPEGKKDPDLAILRVRVEHAAYWNPKTCRMVEMTGLLDAVIARRADGEPVKSADVPPQNPLGGAQG